VRLAIRLAGILVVLVVAALLAVAVALPRLAQSDAARARIEGLAREATGRAIRYRELDFGLMPPRLLVRQPEVKGESDGAPPAFEAAGVELEIALAPLLSWTVVVDSLAIEGATFRLLRTSEGIELPGKEAVAEEPTASGAAPPSLGDPSPEPAGADARPPSPSQPEKPAREAAPSEEEGSEPEGDEEGFTLAVRELVLRDSRLLLEDRTVSPPAAFELQGLVAKASGESIEAPIDFEIDGVLASGGSLRATGEAEIEGPFRIDLLLTDVALAPLAPYLKKGQRVGGVVSGTVSTLGKERESERISVDVRVGGGELAAEDLSVRGEMKIRAELEGGLGDASGTFQLDATDAELEYGAAFRKGRGTAATATGRIVTGPGGQIGLQDTQVKIKNFEAEVQLETGARDRTSIEAEPFELTGWGEMIPALAGSHPAGELAIRGLVVTSEPLEVRGALDLRDLRLRRKGGAEVVLRGRLLGSGPEIRSENLTARIADQEIRISALVTGLAGRPRFATQLEADAVESSALLALVTEKSDTLQGPLELRGKLAGPLGGDRPLAETLEGKLRMRIEPGRLKGVSVLEKTFQGVGGRAGEAALLAGRLEGGRTLQRFYDDEFQYLGGTLRIARGRARTNDLRLVYRNYTVDLRGTVGLRDQALDLQGELTIDREIDGAIASGGPADPKRPPGRSRVIPLARVGGTLESPKVKITDEAVVRLAAIYATGERREEWEGKIDKYLGKGAGSQVLDSLDEILKGEPREPRE
jgi:hypothetical protein